MTFVSNFYLRCSLIIISCNLLFVLCKLLSPSKSILDYLNTDLHIGIVSKVPYWSSCISEITMEQDCRYRLICRLICSTVSSFTFFFTKSVFYLLVMDQYGFLNAIWKNGESFVRILKNSPLPTQIILSAVKYVHMHNLKVIFTSIVISSSSS